jgi:diguanylate cyclase (GGDEF)-like protein/PAS domain S-box-containing protein
VTITALRDERGTLRGFAKVTRDSTARRETEAALRASEERYRRAFDDAAIGMALVGLDGRFLQVNPALCALLGRTAPDLLTRDFQSLTHSDDLDHALGLVRSALAGAISTYVLEKRYLRPDGRVVWAQVNVSVVRDEAGAPVHFLSQFQDIDARKVVEAQLRHQALHDQLTGLPNRALFLDRLVGALARRLRRDEQIGVCFLDLDGFKAVNDQRGHAAGDRLLAAIGERLRLTVRAGDTVARFGGDEFTVLLEGGIVAADVARLVPRLMAAIEEPILLDGREERVSASIGIALSPPVGDTAEALLAAADAAMYRAKELGRGCWIVADREALR